MLHYDHCLDDEYSKPLYDLTAYAKGDDPALIDSKGAKQVVFPDLHDNTLGFLLRLEAHGILKLKPDQRRQVAEIYLGSEKLTPENRERFRRILKEVEVDKNKFESLLLIGDVFGDRGKSDVLTVDVLDMLLDEKINVDILFSNHDLEIIMWRL